MRDEPQTIAGKVARARNARERGRLRVAEVVKANHSLTWERGGWTFELERAPWDKASPKDAERHAAVYDLRVTEGEKVIFRDRVQCWDGSPVMVPDGTFDVQGNPRFREDPVEAARIDLEHTVKVVTKGGREPWVKAKPGTVSTFYADTADAIIQSQSANYADARAGSGTFSVSDGGNEGEGGGWSIFTTTYRVSQGFFPFDTSALGDDDEITDVTFSLRVNSVGNADNWDTIYARAYDFGASITTADYRPTNGTSAGDTLLASIARTSITTGAYNDFTSELAFTSAVNKAGETRFYVVMSNAEAATAPTGANRPQVAMANVTGTTQDPKLVVTHTPAGAEGTIAATLQPATASLTGTHEQSGTIAAELQPATATATGTHEQTGTVAAQVQPATAALSGTMHPAGTIAATIQAATAALSGQQAQTGAIAATLLPATAAAEGAQSQTGTIAATIRAATAALAGAMQPSGTIAASVQPATAAATGQHEQTGAVAATLQPAVAALVGTHAQTAAIIATLQAATAALTGVMQPAGEIAAALQAATASLTGASGYTGTVAGSLRPATASLTGTQAQQGIVAASVQPATAAASGAMQPSGAVAATLQAATAALSGTSGFTGTISATLQAATAAIAGTQTVTGTISATLQPATAAATGEAAEPPTGTIAATLRAATAALTATHEQAGSIAASVQSPTAAATGQQVMAGVIAATIQTATAALSGRHGQSGQIAATLQMATVALLGKQTIAGTVAATLRPATAALLQITTVLYGIPITAIVPYPIGLNARNTLAAEVTAIVPTATPVTARKV